MLFSMYVMAEQRARTFCAFLVSAVHSSGGQCWLDKQTQLRLSAAFSLLWQIHQTHLYLKSPKSFLHMPYHQTTTPPSSSLQKHLRSQEYDHKCAPIGFYLDSVAYLNLSTSSWTLSLWSYLSTVQYIFVTLKNWNSHTCLTQVTDTNVEAYRF